MYSAAAIRCAYTVREVLGLSSLADKPGLFIQAGKVHIALRAQHISVCRRPE